MTERETLGAVWKSLDPWLTRIATITVIVAALGAAIGIVVTNSARIDNLIHNQELIRGEITGIRGEITGIRGEIAEIRREMDAGFAEFRSDIRELLRRSAPKPATSEQ